MAGFFQQFVRGAVNGFLGSPNLKDYTHASKTFTGNAYANAPKFKWLFHVYFDINKTFITDNAAVFPDTTNYGLLVKSIDLPKYQISLQELNQYNRKRYVQTKISYEPIRAVFHDDNANQIRHLWHAYYSYYYNDPSQPDAIATPLNAENGPSSAASELNNRNIYDNNYNQPNWGYLGEINTSSIGYRQKVPFFKSIKIYGFNQHNFALYELINPIIENFSHDNYNYAEGNGTMDSSMSIKYETVKYYSGALNGQNPGAIVNGFGNPGVYDTELSPINRPGTNKSIMGPNGLLESSTGVLNDLANGNILGAIQTAGRLGRTFKNPREILSTAKSELIQGAISAASNPQTVRSAFNLPALGGTTGVNSQAGSATNSRNTQAPPVQVASNSTIRGDNPGGP